MAKADVNYSALDNDGGNPFVQQQTHDRNSENELVSDSDIDDAQHNSEIMIHVVPDTSKARWNHIEDLDSFFTRMYNYHQKSGFTVMMSREVLELCQFLFVFTFITFLTHCVNYPVLFKDVTPANNHTKITIDDVLYTTDQCVNSISGTSWIMISLAILFCIFRLLKVVSHAMQFWDIKKFFNCALKIDDNELGNLTWHEVQRKVIEVQSEQQMCIHKEHLTELDIYHRILRFKNYMVAMMNKNLLPSKMDFPLIGEVVCFSRGLKFSIELILFRGPWSPFENNWHLKEEFKRSNKRIELSQKLSKQIFWIGFVYLIMSPLIFLWSAMVFFFSYADLIKREPSTLGTRCWSQYGMLYCRHFNELDHELQARLSRAYRPACKYMNSFSSPLMAVFAENIVFFCGGILTILILLTIYDEDVALVEHVLTIISVLTMLVIVAKIFLPDENLIWCPEQLMTAVLAHTHYLPVTWRGLAHKNHVRDQFGQFFQLRAIYLINELLSPISIPIMLIFYVRPRALDIVDFFRNFTVSVVGVGDVCSFAQMDVRKHGNPDWQPTTSGTLPSEVVTPVCETNQYTQGEHGKTELSLVHFTLTNPGWKMPVEAKQFVHGIRRQAHLDIENTRTGINNTAMGQSLFSVGSMGNEYSSIVQSIVQTQNLFGSQLGMSMFRSHGPNSNNPFSAAAAAQGPHQQPHQPAAQTSSFDFQHMLQQHLSDGGHATATGPMGQTIRSTILTNINEDEDDVAAPNVRSGYERTAHSMLGTSMGMSMKGGLNRCEGPPEGSQDGLLYSMYSAGAVDAVPREFTAADMCLSTLYLHELYNRQIKRRGRVEQSQRQLWERPHQQQSSASTTLPFGNVLSPQQHASSSSSALAAAEKTPLLSSKKS